MHTERIYLIQDTDGDAICWTTDRDDIEEWMNEHPLADIVNIQMTEVAFYYTVEFSSSYADE